MEKTPKASKDCKRKTFILDYTYNAYKPHMKETAFKMIMNDSGTRDTGQFLKISPNTVISILKKQKIILKE